MMSQLATFLGTKHPYVIDGGLETDLIFNEGIDLPFFAAFVLLENARGRADLERYFDRYLDIAEALDRGFMLDTVTWRANAGWAPKLGLDAEGVRNLNRLSVHHAGEIRARRNWAERILINGSIGPGGDGYAPEALLTPDEAQVLHGPQIKGLAEGGADLATALTMTHVGEAIGIVRAAEAAGLPIVISFTVETNGRLPVGTPLGEAIAAVEAATGSVPLYYGVNCAHPDHFLDQLSGDWTEKIGVVRANASRLSHAELDEATELDDGDPEEFGRLYGELVTCLPNLRVIGGCCGSDHRHVGAAVRQH